LEKKKSEDKDKNNRNEISWECGGIKPEDSN
jgi:hypothetical protein